MKTPPPNIPPVPEGFEYFGNGPLKHRYENPSSDVVAYWGKEWVIPNKGGTLAHYALRIGSEVHRKNMPKPEPVESYWWPLWKHMSESHGLTLLDDECVQIARAVDEVRAKDAKADTDAVAACDAWVKLFVELGRALGMTRGNGNDVLAEVRRRVQAHSEVVAAFDVAKSALAIVRKERDEKAEQLQIALKENNMLSNAIRNAAYVEANLSKP